MSLSRADRKKLLLAQGALYRYECMQARVAIGETLDGVTRGGMAGALRSLGGRGLVSTLTTLLPLVLGAGRVARLLKRGMLVGGGVAAAWSAISRWREQAAQDEANNDANNKANNEAKSEPKDGSKKEAKKATGRVADDPADDAASNAAGAGGPAH